MMAKMKKHRLRLHCFAAALAVVMLVGCMAAGTGFLLGPYDPPREKTCLEDEESCPEIIAEATANIESARKKYCTENNEETCLGGPSWHTGSEDLGGPSLYAESEGLGEPSLYAESKGEWQLWCKDDELESKRDCKVGISEITVHVSSRTVGGHAQAGLLVTFGEHRYPGSYNIIKIDDAEPIRWREDEYPLGIYQEIVAQLKTGKRAHTRYSAWPIPAHRDSKFSIEGFAPLYEEAVRKVQTYKK